MCTLEHILTCTVVYTDMLPVFSCVGLAVAALLETGMWLVVVCLFCL